MQRIIRSFTRSYVRLLLAMLVALGLILPGTLTVGATTLQSEEYDFPSINSKINRFLENNPDVSLGVALVHGDRIEWLGNYDRSGNSAKVYRVGSLAKVVTALAVMRLADQSLIDIDQPIFAYLPRFSVKRRFSDVTPITVRHLLSHHSGLPTNIVKGQWSDAHFSTVVEQLRSEFLTYPPDFVRSYSNIGYNLLGLLIEEVSGQSYESYVQENIFQPLEMHHSSFDPRTVTREDFVGPAVVNSKQPLLPIRDVPAMGMYSSAEDLARLIMMLGSHGSYRGKRVFHSAVLEEMMERNNEDVMLDYDLQDGLGLRLNHCVLDHPGDVVEHGGHTMHYASHFVAVPRYGVGAVVISNSRSAKHFVHTLARDLVAAALDKHYPDEKKPQSTAIRIAGKSGSNEIKSVSSLYAKYLTKSGLLTLHVDESDMCACIDEKRLDLVPMPDGWYGVRNRKKNPNEKSIELSQQEVDGQVVLAMRKGDREQRLGEYIPEEGIPAVWRNRLGHYQVENPDAEFPFSEVGLLEEDNLMFLSYRMPLLSDKLIQLPLTPLDDQQAITTGLGRGRGETVLAKQTAEGEYLLYSGYLIKKLTN